MGKTLKKGQNLNQVNSLSMHNSHHKYYIITFITTEYIVIVIFARIHNHGVTEDKAIAPIGNVCCTWTQCYT